MSPLIRAAIIVAASIGYGLLYARVLGPGKLSMATYLAFTLPAFALMFGVGIGWAAKRDGVCPTDPERRALFMTAGAASAMGSIVAAVRIDSYLGRAGVLALGGAVAALMVYLLFHPKQLAKQRD
jgi:hypothetical protein